MGMEGILDTIRALFTRDLATTTLETALFLFIIFGFFGVLILSYHIQKKREAQRVYRALEEKWERLCRTYKLNDRERAFLEELAEYLKKPEKKYLLLAQGDVFHNTLREYSARHRPDAEIVNSIVEKTGIVQRKDLLFPLPVQRRKNARKKVNITVEIAPVERERPPIQGTMLNISKGGCMTTNPGLRFQPGEDLRLTFTLQGRRYSGIPAEVIRTSSGEQRLHIAFGHVRK
jgi:hypothetical protein